jgi:phage tail sheath protein FI
MPEYLSPGVYIEEQDTGPQPIEGVSTSVTGFVGVTQSGPLDGKPPVLVTSFPEFTRTFGGYFVPSFTTPGSPPWNYLPHAVYGFFVNGGQLLYIKRVASSASAPVLATSTDVEGGILTRLASNVLTGATSAKLLSTRGIQVGTVLTLTEVESGITTSSGPLTVSQYDDPSGTVWFGPALEDSFYSDYTTVAVAGIALALEKPANVGDTSVTLSSFQGIQQGSVLNFTQVVGGVTTNSGPLTVSATPTTTSVSFTPALTAAFVGTSVVTGSGVTTALTADTAVGATSITLASVQGILPTDTLTLTQGATTAGPLSILSISPSTGSITLTAALTSAFTATTVIASGGGIDGSLATTLQVDAASGSTTIQVASLTGIQVGSVVSLVQLSAGISVDSGPLLVSAVNTATDTVTFAPALTAIFPKASTAVMVDPMTSFAVAAANAGSWGNNIQLTIANSSRAQAQVQSVSASSPGVFDTVLLNSTANFYTNAVVEFSRGASKVYAKIKAVIGSSIQVQTAFPSAAYLNPDSSSVTTVRTCEFDVSASYGTVNETFRGLTLDDTTPYYYATIITNTSTLLSIPASAGSDDTSQNPFTMPVGFDGLDVEMAGGTDGGAAPTPIDIVGSDGGPGNRTGIQALIDAAEISIIAAPGITDQDTQNALIDQCQTLKYRFAILDPAPPVSPTTSLQDIQTQRLQYDTEYAAIYYPRVVVTDPLTDNSLTIPPSGHMAGIYAQTDDSRGVWKAPANIVIAGIDSLETKLSKGDQDILNPEPNNINALRDFTAQGRGLRVYGARCITSDTEWMYINVRRLFIFLEASLDQGTQWAVFEPNDQTLWNRLIQSVSNFLTTVWREGGLMGSKASEAFFVKCGYDTMSQDDIENGRLIMLVGVAPVYPAEFVIIRIGQWTGGSSVQEL